MRRVPQPPLNPALRDLERHDFWPGFIAALIGIILTFCGARHLTAVDTVDGGNAWETQLIKAFTFDGLQYAEQSDAAAAAERGRPRGAGTLGQTKPRGGGADLESPGGYGGQDALSYLSEVTFRPHGAVNFVHINGMPRTRVQTAPAD